MDNSSQPSAGRSPFKDITNTATDGAANVGNGPSRRGRYALMSDERRQEYLEKQRIVDMKLY
jgi:hypothetical protein